MNERFNERKTFSFSKTDLRRLNERTQEFGFSSNSATLRYLIKKG